MRIPPIVLALVSLLLCGSCVKVGPRAVRTDRVLYNEVVVQTNNEQMLLNLVRLRYRDTPAFLEVASVATQYDLEVSGLASAQAGDTDSVGAALGAVYAERPTVSYTPLTGDKFVRSVLSPVPIESLLLLSQSGWSIDRILRVSTQRINDLWNAPRATGPTPTIAPEFRDFRVVARLARELQLHRHLELGHRVDSSGRTVFLRIGECADHAPVTRQMLELLGVAPDVRELTIVTDPVTRAPGQLAIVPRSVIGTMFYLSQGVEPPGAHEESGWVTVTAGEDDAAFDWQELMGGLLRIQSDAEKPEEAFVSVFYRGHWFWIDDSDLDSKTTFALLTQLFHLQAGDPRPGGPLLTLPVGG